MALKKRQFYELPASSAQRNAIYEPELVQLLKRGAVEQVAITIIEGGYTVAILANHRAEPTGQGGADSNVVRLRPVRVETEGFAPLFAVRHRSIRVYRSLDTLIKSILRFAPLPPTTIQQGVKP
jgi:hypothetical protein